MNEEYPLDTSKRYSRIKGAFFAARFSVTIISFVVFYLFLSRPVFFLAYGISPNFYAACFIFLCVFLAFGYIVDFPLHFINSFFVEKSFGLSRQSLSSWFSDELKGAGLSLLLSICCILIFYAVLRNFPSSWWLISSFLWIFLSIIMARFFPILIIPLFFKYTPIKDEGIRARIVSLAKKADIYLMDVCKIDFSRKTLKANAALVGLGSTRKVILADTLMDRFTLDEIEPVVAHEFGHFKRGHIWQLLAFAGLTTITEFLLLFIISGKIVVMTNVADLSDLRLLPLLALLASVFGMAVLPFQNFASRALERQADTFALGLTGKPRDFILVMKKLASMNLSDINPSIFRKIFLYDHPPISERIKMAEEYTHSYGRD